jgi:hypothetical protein
MSIINQIRNYLFIVIISIIPANYSYANFCPSNLLFKSNLDHANNDCACFGKRQMPFDLRTSGQGPFKVGKCQDIWIIDETPKTLPNLVAWYDAYDVNDDKYMIDPETKVKTWFDKDDSANDLVQNDINKRPTYKITSKNDTGYHFPALQFDGVNDFFCSLLPLPSFSSGLTLFLVIKIINPNPDNFVRCFLSNKGNGSNINNTFSLCRLNNGNKLRFWINGNSTPVSVTSLIDANDVQIVTISIDAQQNDNNNYSKKCKFFFGRDQHHGRDHGEQSGGKPPKSPYLGGSSNQLCVGAENTTNNFVNQQIMELIIYSDELSNGEQDIIEKYLRDKWGSPSPNDY